MYMRFYYFHKEHYYIRVKGVGEGMDAFLNILSSFTLHIGV